MLCQCTSVMCKKLQQKSKRVVRNFLEFRTTAFQILLWLYCSSRAFPSCRGVAPFNFLYIWIKWATFEYPHFVAIWDISSHKVWQLYPFRVAQFIIFVKGQRGQNCHCFWKFTINFGSTLSRRNVFVVLYLSKERQKVMCFFALLRA